MARKPSPGANLTTIATSLGLSVSTASRAIRNADGIHPETRRLVLEKAGELGYVLPGLQGPDIHARPHQILALATSVAPGTDQGFLTGMSRTSIAMNLAVLSHHVQPDDCSSVLDHERQPVAMRAGMVDGVVLIHYWPAEVAARIAERFPTVSIVHQYSATEADHVGVDDRRSVDALLDHLVAGGHSKIGFFGYCRQVSWSRSRLAAYFESLLRLGMTQDARDVCPVSLQQSLTNREFSDDGWGAKVLARIKQGVDAWICPSAGTASSLLDFLLQKGVKVPRDVAVASCSERYQDRNHLPQLTMMHVVSEELGAAALRRLVNRLQTPREVSRSVLLPPEFVMGETTRSVARNRLREKS
jgi:DNA-binding LacI/PurR family transcriptional regulator